MVIHPISGSKSQQRSNPVSVDRWCLLGQGCRGCCTNTRSVQVFPSVSTRPGHCTPHTQQCNTTAIRSPSTQHAESTQYVIVTEKLLASQDFEYPECYGQEMPWFRQVDLGHAHCRAARFLDLPIAVARSGSFRTASVNRGAAILTSLICKTKINLISNEK